MCRGFLDVAKVAAMQLAKVIFNDGGMSSQLKALYSSQDWYSGKTSATLLATLKDYMNDVQVCGGRGWEKVEVSVFLLKNNLCHAAGLLEGLHERCAVGEEAEADLADLLTR